MAVPSILSITPAAVPVLGGSMVEILGDHFRLPTVPPPTGAAPEPVPSVLVTFGGRASRKVLVVSENRLLVLVPSTPLADGAGEVDVVITNIDDDGDVISGEIATRVDGLEYERVPLDATADQSALEWVTRWIRRELSRQTISEVVHSQNVDWTALPLAEGTTKAKLPALALIGPDAPENRFYSTNEAPEVDVPGTDEFVRKHVPYTVDLVFQLVGVADSSAVALKLMTLVIEFFHSNKYLRVPSETGDADSELVDYEMDFMPGGQPRWRSGSSESNIRLFDASFVIRGVDLEGIGEEFSRRVIDRSAPLTGDPELETGVEGDGRTPPAGMTYGIDPGPYQSPYQIGSRYGVGPSSGQ